MDSVIVKKRGENLFSSCPSAYKLSYKLSQEALNVYLIGNIHGLRHCPQISQTPYDTAKLEIVSRHFIQSIRPEYVIFEGTAHAHAALKMPADAYNQLYKRDSESYLSEAAKSLGSSFQYLESTDYHKTIFFSAINLYGIKYITSESYQKFVLKYPNLGWVVGVGSMVSLVILPVLLSYFILSKVFINSSAIGLCALSIIAGIQIQYLSVQRTKTIRLNNLNIQMKAMVPRIALFFETLKTTPLEVEEKKIADLHLAATVRNQDWADKIKSFMENNVLSVESSKGLLAYGLLKIENKLKQIFNGSEYPLPVLPGDDEKLNLHKKIVQHLNKTCNLSVPALPTGENKAVIFSVGLAHIEGMVEELKKLQIDAEPIDLLPNKLLANVNEQIQLLKSSGTPAI